MTSQISAYDLERWVESNDVIQSKFTSLNKEQFNLRSRITHNLEAIFREYLDKEVKISFYLNDTIIEVSVPLQLKESLRLSSEFIDALGMPVTISYDNEREIVFRLFPRVQYTEILKKECETAPIEDGTDDEDIVPLYEEEPAPIEDGIDVSEHVKEDGVLLYDDESVPEEETIAGIIARYEGGLARD